MPDTKPVHEGVEPKTRTVLNLGLYLERTTALGATDEQSRAKVAGISRSTQNRWIKGKTEPDPRKARAAAKRLRVTRDELFAEVAA